MFTALERPTEACGSHPKGGSSGGVQGVRRSGPHLLCSLTLNHLHAFSGTVDSLE